MRSRLVKISWTVLFIFSLNLPFLGFSAENAPAGEIKNLIIMIPDGMGSGAYTLARWAGGAKPLAMDKLVCGIVKTCGSDAVIPDSAAAATAYSTGFKTHSGYVGVLPEISDMPGGARLPRGCDKIPVCNVMEAARVKGLSTGIVSTTETMHATPAAFSAHCSDRGNYNDIGEQQVFAGFDVVLGGGAKFLKGGNRADGEDLLSEIKSLGYEIAGTADELEKSSAGKLWGIFAEVDMCFDIERAGSGQPSLEEMTEKAIEVLKANDKGFLLMVEGSKIDYAAHANDPATIAKEILAFDRAVAKALDFARTSGNTAILIAPDHGTGGASIGNMSGSGTRPEDFISVIIPAKTSADSLAKDLCGGADDQSIRNKMEEKYSIEDLSDAELSSIKSAVASAKTANVCSAICSVLNARSRIGWTSNGHTGDDVLLFAYSPGWRPEGAIDSTDIAYSIAKLLDLNLKETSQKLMRDAGYELQKAGLEFSIEGKDGPNPVLLVSRNGRKIEFPANRSYAVEDGRRIPFEYGASIFNGSKWHMPLCAVKIAIGEE